MRYQTTLVPAAFLVPLSPNQRTAIVPVLAAICQSRRNLPRVLALASVRQAAASRGTLLGIINALGFTLRGDHQ